MRFADITGYDDVKHRLRQAVRSGQVAHAQLFAGMEGTPNLPLALAYVQFLNCEDRQPDDACGRCPACSKINHLVHPDLHFVFPTATLKGVDKDRQAADLTRQFRAFVEQEPYGALQDWTERIGATRAPNITVDDSRHVVRTLSLKAFEAHYKAVLIWLPETMNIPSANALLKIIEEPPARTLFLLVSHQPDQLLTTIRSRVQMMRVRPAETHEIVEHLRSQGLADGDRAGLLATLADGSTGRAVRLAAHETNNYHQLVVTWLRHCYARKFDALVAYTDEFHKLGREAQKGFVRYALTLTREVLMQQLTDGSLNRVAGEALDFVGKFSQTLRPEHTERIAYLLNEAYYHLERNANPKIVLLDTSLSMAR
ncbi:MAG: DNA polymerase III subunit delta', partial [Catalinimonas sp.]